MSEQLPPGLRTATAKTIEAKRDKLLKEREELFQERQKILQLTRHNDRDLADCRAAARLFGLEIDFPSDERDEMDREMVRRRAELEAREHILRREREARAITQRVAEDAEKAMTIVRGASDAKKDAAVSAPVKTSRPPLRVVVLEQLKAAGDAGAKAATIRDYIERTFGEVLHEKTVGMTLFRLSKKGLVRRDGQTWFAVPQRAEVTNPGGRAPGLINRSV